jgi:hypothetical protein
MGMFDRAALPGNAALDLRGKGAWVGFAAGFRKLSRRARASSSPRPLRSQCLSGAKRVGASHGSMNTGHTKFGLLVIAAHWAEPQFLVKTPDLLIWEIPSSRMPASVPSDPHRSQNSVDCHIDRGPLRGLLSHPSQALMACNESGPRT